MNDLAGRKILIVDDDRFIRNTVKLVLRAIDHFVIAEADDGDVGLVRADEFKPDVVLCDITMPRMGGLQFVAQLRKHPQQQMRDIPVVILTGQAEETTVQTAVKLQISGFLVKPVSPKTLGAYLQKILGKNQSTPAS
jgi:two-component system chemotaxis response regulator CheY